MKNLFIFDFDDTLAHSDIPVFVKMKNGERIRLTSKEFAKYNLSPGDLFDFSEFDKIIKTATPIEVHVNMLREALSKPNNKVTILTARSLAYPVSYWLRTMVGVNPYVVAVAGSDPNLKKDYIEREIKKGFRNVFFIDDSVANIMAVDTLKEKYPDVNIITKVADKDNLNENERRLGHLIKREIKKMLS